MDQNNSLPSDYRTLLKSVKKQIQESRIRAYRSVNKELIQLYWNIGKEILERQESEGWGKSIVKRLSHDLRKEFPGTSGFSSQNLWYMRQFYSEYRDHVNLQQLVGEIPWGHNLLLLSRIKDMQERDYYLRMTAELGWSRPKLKIAISIRYVKNGALTPPTTPALSLCYAASRVALTLSFICS